jgi:hypothetical protein
VGITKSHPNEGGFAGVIRQFSSSACQTDEL